MKIIRRIRSRINFAVCLHAATLTRPFFAMRSPNSGKCSARYNRWRSVQNRFIEDNVDRTLENSQTGQFNITSFKTVMNNKQRWVAHEKNGTDWNSSIIKGQIIIPSTEVSRICMRLAKSQRNEIVVHDVNSKSRHSVRNTYRSVLMLGYCPQLLTLSSMILDS